MKKAKASEGSAAAAGEPLQAATRALQPSRPVPPPPTRSSPRPPLPTISPPPKVVQPPISTALPRAPSLAFLHPNSLTPPKPRRLLPSFVSPSSAVSVLPSRPAPSAFFLPNPTLLSHSTAYAGELDTADKLHEEGTLEAPPGIEDGFNPAVFAAKALGIATLLSFGTFGVGIFGLMKYFGVDDVRFFLSSSPPLVPLHVLHETMAHSVKLLPIVMKAEQAGRAALTPFLLVLTFPPSRTARIARPRSAAQRLPRTRRQPPHAPLLGPAHLQLIFRHFISPLRRQRREGREPGGTVVLGVAQGGA